MFNNIGGKIKVLAQVECWLGIIGSGIYAIYLWVNGGGSAGSIIRGLIFLAGGALLSWIGSFFMYGFGELIDQATEINGKLKSGTVSGNTPVAVVTQTDKTGTQTTATIKTAANLTREEEILSKGGWKCSGCGTLNYHYSASCTKCHAKRYQSLATPDGKQPFPDD